MGYWSENGVVPEKCLSCTTEDGRNLYVALSQDGLCGASTVLLMDSNRHTVLGIRRTDLEDDWLCPRTQPARYHSVHLKHPSNQAGCFCCEQNLGCLSANCDCHWQNRLRGGVG